MGIPVFLARAVTSTTADQLTRSQFLQPLPAIRGQSYYVFVHQNTLLPDDRETANRAEDNPAQQLWLRSSRHQMNPWQR
jgi:hypothetical protein